MQCFIQEKKIFVVVGCVWRGGGGGGGARHRNNLLPLPPLLLEADRFACCH